MTSLNKSGAGFTLVEILVVIGIVGMVIAFGMITDLSVIRGDTFRAERAIIVAALEKARSRAMANFFESPHGVCYLEPNYVIFRGSCVVSATNELISANTNIATASNFSSDFPTVIFDQLSGNSSDTTINITDGVKSADITINDAGTINW